MPLKTHDEAQALLALKSLNETGHLSAPLTDHVAHQLLADRFAREDATGGLTLTERGMERLQRLRHSGALKSIRAQQASRWDRRRGS